MKRTSKYLHSIPGLSLIIGLICLSSPALLRAEELKDAQSNTDGPETSSEQSDADSHEAKKMRRITVTGGNEETIDLVPGSAYYIDEEQLEETKGAFGDVNRILRQVPGINLTEEEGYGLRPNIGFRGTSTERSANITLMEDGVLIAPAPYAAPSAYYFPTTARMSAIEILKGAAQVKYGPHTTGGSLNLLSTKIPEKFSLYTDVKTGMNNTRIGNFHVGGASTHAGFMLETYQAVTDGFKDLDNGGDTGYDLEDYVAKLRVNSDPDNPNYHELELKLQRSNQISNETYLGLTRSDFDADPFRRYSGSQRDRIDVDHDQVQLTYFGDFEAGFDLTVTGYYNETRRNWYKLEQVGGQGTSSILSNPTMYASELSWIKGTDSPDDAFSLRANNRQYESKGIQSAIGTDFEIGSTEHDLEVGVRYHEDEEDRLQHEDGYRMDNNTLVLTSLGDPGSQDNRIGSAEAWSFYAQDVISYGDFTFTPGVRYELIDFLRREYGTADPSRSGLDLEKYSTDVAAIIPGGGMHYQFTEEFSGFVGLHKGFSPPGPTKSNEVDEEESINYETGVNYNRGALRSEVIFFYNDYDNLLGADTASSGGTGSGDLFNGGKSTVYGAEVSTTYDFAELLETSFSVPLRGAYTYTSAEFDSSFDSEFFGSVQDGDNIPYIAQNQLYLSLGAEWERFDVNLAMTYVDAMPTAAGQSGTVSEDPTDSYVVFDLLSGYKLTEQVRIYGLIENLFDQEYIVSNRPAGARPGRPLTAMAGITIDISDLTDIS